jgi:ring-1,2-phenylacetyl-CoA epoxidase subunit PaaB
MNNQSFDPRVNRLKLGNADEPISVDEGENWNIYEVFHQEKRGAHHEHVGCVHAPDPQMALVFAKEQFGRRKKCVNLWVVRSADILAFDLEDEDMFANNQEKTYRDASGFKVMEKVNKMKSAKAAAKEEPDANKV